LKGKLPTIEEIEAELSSLPRDKDFAKKSI